MQLRRVLPFFLLSSFVVPSLFAQQRKSPQPPIAVRPAIMAPVAGCAPNHFLTRAYQDLLGRPLDAGGAAYWLQMMKNGISRTQVALQLMRNSAYTNARVQAFFSSYLHRLPNASELSYFSTMLQHSSSEQVESAILGSAEYFSERGGGTDSGFIAALYQDVLGRAASPAEIAFFAQQLRTASRASVAQQVLNSPVARQRWINALYTRYLHRAASGTPMFGDEDQVTAAIIGSEEYCRQ